MVVQAKFNVVPFNLIFNNVENVEEISFPAEGRNIHNAACQNNNSTLLKRNKIGGALSGSGKIKTLCFVIIVLANFLLLNQTSLAISTSNLPSGLCSSSHYQCDTKTLTRWTQFQNSNGINIGSPAFLSVGSCSVNGESNSHVNVLLALSKNVDELYFDASISFYNDLKRYKNTPASQIKNIFPDIHLNQNKLTLSDTHAYIDYSEIAPYRYWVRYYNQSNKILMVGYFGYIGTFLCEFDGIGA